MNDLLVEIREADGTTVVTRSRAVSIESVRAIDESGRLAVSVPGNEPAATALTTGRYVVAMDGAATINVGLIDEPAVRAYVGGDPQAQCSMFDRFADLYREGAEDSRWVDTALETVLGTAAGTPPGLLYGTGWTLDIAAAVGTAIVTQEAQGEKLADMIKKSVADVEVGGTPVHWWADPVSRTLHVGFLGSSSGLRLAGPDAPDPGGTLPTVTIISLEEKGTGEIINRVDPYGGTAGGQTRLQLWGTETGQAYTPQVRTSRMGGTIHYLEDAASTAAYGLWAAEYSDNTADPANLTGGEARGLLYRGACAHLARHKDPHQAWQVEARGSALRNVDPGESCALWYHRRYVNVLETGATVAATQSLNTTGYCTKVVRRIDAAGERFSLELGSTLDHKIGSTPAERIGKAIAAAAHAAGGRSVTRLVTAGGVPSTGAAPANATFVTISAESGLSAETQHASIAIGDRHPPAVHRHDSDADSGGNKLGGTADYTEVEDDGTLHFVGAATVWDDVNVGSVSLGAAASAPDPVQIASSGIYVKGFDGNVTAEQLFGEMELPHDYLEESDFVPHVHWMPSSTAVGTVMWQMTYLCAGDGDTDSAGTTITVLADAPGVAYKRQRADFGTVSGAGHAIGDQFTFRLFRVPTEDEDSYPDDALVETIGIHYQKDTCGSRQITTK